MRSLVARVVQAAGGRDMAVDKRWVFPDPIPASVDSDLKDFAPIERQVLWSRRLTARDEALAFLQPEASRGYDPCEIRGMDAAVERLASAREAGERVAIYGDYDVDGVTATALLVEVLTGLGFQARAYIPNRFDEGYGLHTEALAGLRAEGIGLVVTVDCGIRSVGEAAAARSLGLDLIITDHHQPGGELPDVHALLCPKREGDSYPFKQLAGVGLAYKLAEGLAGRLGGGPLEAQLDLVALGTIADLAPLVDENRLLVWRGLQWINTLQREGADHRPGLTALAGAAGIARGKVTATSVAFGLAPRLNAAGRLDSALTSLRLLATAEPQEAADLARELDSANRRRQALTAETVERARRLVLDGPAEPNLLVAADPSFSEGIVGLAAARLVEEFYRPAIVLVVRDDDVRGSARSIPEFHITQALDACADLLREYGGHAMAAGFTAGRQESEALLGRLRVLADASLGKADLRPQVQIDAVTGFEAVGEDLLRFLDRLEPCGYGNRRPLLASRRVQVVRSRPVGADGKHLKLTLRDRARVFDAIAFRQGGQHGRLPGVVDVAYHLERDSYLGVESLQLNVVDVRPAG